MKRITFKNIMRPRNLPSFVSFVSLFFLLLLTSCIIPLPYFPEGGCNVRVKINNFRLYQKPNHNFINNPSMLDSIYYGIWFNEEDLIYIDKNYDCFSFTVLDTFKSIQIITLRKYNAQYDSLDTITSNFKISQYCPKPKECYSYNSITDLFNAYHGKVPVPLTLDSTKFTLISPPSLKPVGIDSLTGDTIFIPRDIQFKFILQLIDSRKFELISNSIFVTP